MGWDVGYSGSCASCGESIHQCAEDRPRMTAVWLRCPKCLKARTQQIDDGTEAKFWSVAHPCADCGSEQERWNAARCPRCGSDDTGRMQWMAD